MPISARSGAQPASTRIDLAKIFKLHGNDFLKSHRIAHRHLKVMRAIVNCRTAALGGHRHRCNSCHYERFVYHSCRNRHCPKCQTRAKEAWRKARQLELLPVPYFHQVFTLPHELNPWILACEDNQRLLLKLLFDAASATLLEFGRGEFGGQVGFTMVLHTWDQQLRPHFHLHALVASGALSGEGRWRAGGAKFLFPVRALSKMFRGKFLAGLRNLIDTDQLVRPQGNGQVASPERQLLRQVSRKPWVVYSKAPFAGPRKLLDYLSRYTHRVAISNDRLLACRDGQVAFGYRDRRDGDRRKVMKLPVEKFIGRFLRHVLPDRFMRIHHYGFMSNGHRRAKLAEIRSQLGVTPRPAAEQEDSLEQWIREVLGIDLEACPCCGDELIPTQLTPLRPAIQLCRPHRHSRGPPTEPTT